MLLLSYDPKAGLNKYLAPLSTLPEETRSYHFGYTGMPIDADPNGWAEFQALEQSLYDEGFELLGTGAFSAAFTHADWQDRVLKVSFNLEYTDDGDPDEVVESSAGARWWQYCLEHQGEDHIPEMYAVGKLNGIAEFCWMKRYDWGDYAERSDVCCEWRHGDKYHSIRVLMWGPVAECGQEDLHSGNLMWCEDREQWMLTDPCS